MLTARPCSGDYFLSGAAVYFIFFRLPAGVVTVYIYICVCVCVCVCSLPRGRRLGACNAWLCSPVRHRRRIAFVAAVARRMRRRNSSIGAPRGDPAPLGPARRQEGRQQEGRWFKVPLSKAANPQRLRVNMGGCCCDPFLYLRLQLYRH